MTTTTIAGGMLVLLAGGYLATAVAAAIRLGQWGYARFLPLAAIVAYLLPPIIDYFWRSFTSGHAIAVYLFALLLLLATALRAWRGQSPLERLLRTGSILWFILIAANTMHDAR